MFEDEAGYPECPQEVTAEEYIIRLFLAYLSQPATADAIMAVAYDNNRLREFANYVATLKRTGSYTSIQ